jgi:hypothetical protein
VLAPLSAVALQNQGFGALSGIFITVVCLTINQTANVVGIRAKDCPNDGSVEALPQQRTDDEPHDGRDGEICSEHKRQQRNQFKRAQLTNPRQADLTP